MRCVRILIYQCPVTVAYEYTEKHWSEKCTVLHWVRELSRVSALGHTLLCALKIVTKTTLDITYLYLMLNPTVNPRQETCRQVLEHEQSLASHPQPWAWRWWSRCRSLGLRRWRPPPRCCTDGSCSGWGFGRKTRPGQLQTRCSPEGQRDFFNFQTEGSTLRSAQPISPTRGHCRAQHGRQNIHTHWRARQCASLVNKRKEGTRGPHETTSLQHHRLIFCSPRSDGDGKRTPLL